MKVILSTLALCLCFPFSVNAQSVRAVLDGYADLALVKYSDSLKTAEELDAAIDLLVANPSESTLAESRLAWLASRVPYQQTEAYRFGNRTVDEWEGKVNAWPLDEGLIDYVDVASYGDVNEENRFFRANVVSQSNIKIGGNSIEASKINPQLLQKLHEIDGIEANVATGYHAIEFLLWGQDLNGNDAGAGDRLHTDYDVNNCTNGNCDRRAAYLKAAASLLLMDLRDMVEAWGVDGAARNDLAAMSDAQGLGAILTGLSSLSYGELAGERMQLGLILNDPEEEQDCFSDNTHNSHYYDALGIQNVYLGHYTTSDGKTIDVPSVSDLVMESNSELDIEMKAKLAATMRAMSIMKDRADSGTEAYDQMIGSESAKGNSIIQAAIDTLIDQTKTIESLVVNLDASGVMVEGSDSLDKPTAVFD